jgi:4'-phosphopantetheinyl transferase
VDAAAQRCDVWWTVPDRFDEDDMRLLNAGERERLEQYRRAEDRARFLAAAALLRRLAAARTGTVPERVVVDRSCRTCTRPHGRPVLPGTGLHASISHSGQRVAVALTGLGPVGVDVEEVSSRIDPAELAGHVLGEGERAADTTAFLRYWTRKEAVVKATGDGIGVELRRVLLGPADQPPRLVGYPDRPGMPAVLADLDPGDGYVGALCVLTDGPVPVTEHWYRDPAG